jgi:hypothetical protein
MYQSPIKRGACGINKNQRKDMSDGQQGESDLLRTLYQIEDDDTTGIYAQAKLDLEKAKKRSPHRSTFDLCRDESEETRKYVAQCFMADGLKAQAMNVEHWNCGDTSYSYIVRVEIPQRVNRAKTPSF